MPLSEDIKALYRVLDSATLLVLLPELREQIKRYKRELEMMSNSATSSQESDLELAEFTGEVLATIEARIPPEEFAQLRDYFNKSRAEVAFNSERHASAFEPRFRELVDLGDRERWIVDELKRRRLLPGEPYLD